MSRGHGAIRPGGRIAPQEPRKRKATPTQGRRMETDRRRSRSQVRDETEGKQAAWRFFFSY
ncbi:MAG: hypothetical protein BroJett031_37410 [Betaproteobacteria bacterium]|nr:MAG: hypothetical protein BroJett031_37410 [Betaproteobacteria bacterium]